jgi:hypothetical protein
MNNIFIHESAIVDVGAKIGSRHKNLAFYARNGHR